LFEETRELGNYGIGQRPRLGLYVRTHLQNACVLGEVPFYVVAVVAVQQGQLVMSSGVGGDGHLEGKEVKEIKELRNC
jgi:hypothetical protein